ncbi:MAG: hypothetical protein AAF662_06660 [Pseudomonadota bacterium]
MAYECKIASNSGMASTTLAFTYMQDQVLIGSLRSEGDFWPQQSDITDKTRTYLLQLENVHFHPGAIQLLIDDLERWLTAPQKIQRHVSTARSGVQIDLVFFDDSSVSQSSDKPWFKLHFSGMDLADAEIVYIVDQSCIQLFCQDLKTAINALS